MKKMHLFLMMLPIALLALSACSPTPAPAPTPTESGLARTSWTLTLYGDIADPHDAVSGVETSLTFGTDGKISGNLGCNSMGGDYSISDQKITFGSVFATEMACDDPRMAQEGAAFQVLQNTVTFKLGAKTLMITSSDGRNILAFMTSTGK